MCGCDIFFVEEERMKIINWAVREKIVEEMKKEAEKGLSGSVQGSGPNDCPKEMCPKCRVEDG